MKLLDKGIAVMPDQAKPTVMIAGAGLGGLTAGLALLRRGFRVRIL
jgi:salicylate hydroxylase